MAFEDCICFQLGKSLREVSKSYREEIAAYSLTHGQFFLLVAIMEKDGILPSELAEKTAQDRAAITGVLDRLAKDGWIERKHDHEDRRSLKIFMTKKAKTHRDDILNLFEKTNQAYLSRFSKEEWNKMQEFLERLEK